MNHPLDANAIAADLHYGQDRPEDFDCCDSCGSPFSDGDDYEAARQHKALFMLCEDCGDEMEDCHD